MARERKELLTEHLCTIISHNEDRKAEKLSELMEKVGLSGDDVQHWYLRAMCTSSIPIDIY